MNTAKNIGPRIATVICACALIAITIWSLLAPVLDPLFDNVRSLASMKLSDIDHYFENIKNQIKAIVAIALVGFFIAYKRFRVKYKEAE